MTRVMYLYNTCFFCLGWITKHLHIIYNYVYNFPVKDRDAVRNLADWMDKDVGRVSASFLSVVTEVDLCWKLMNSLFGEMGLNVRVQYFLLGSLLKGYDKFIDICAEPTGK